MTDTLARPDARVDDTTPRRGQRVAPRTWAYAGPALAVLAVCVYGPMLFTLALSLLDWNLISPQAHWQGLANYQHLLADPTFGQSALNTLWYGLAVLPVATVVPCALAITLWKRPGRRSQVYRTLLFLPVVLAPVANAMAWQFILDPIQGVANHVTGLLGIGPQNWLGSSSTALLTIVVVTAGKIIALNTLLFGAMLAPLNPRTVEAARLDGAREWELTRGVILPQLRWAIVLLGLLSLVVVWPWIFTNIAVLTQGGPDGASTNVYYELYVNAFTYYDAGTAAAVAGVIAAGFAVLLGAYALIGRRARGPA